MAFAAEGLRVLSLIPGRVRLHLSLAGSSAPEQVEARLGRLPGVGSVQLNRLTGNALIHFNPQVTTGPALVAAVRALGQESFAERPSVPLPQSAKAPGGNKYLRAGLRGVLGHALVDTVFYAVTFSQPFGLPLAGLGVLHLGFDLVAWSVALAPLLSCPPPPVGTSSLLVPGTS
jgi:hypothetical protein